MKFTRQLAQAPLGIEWAGVGLLPSTGFDRTTASKWNALTWRGVLAIRKLSGSRNAPRQLKIFSRRETGIMPQIAVESRLKLVSQDAFSPALEEDSSDLGAPSLSKVYVRIEGGE